MEAVAFLIQKLLLMSPGTFPSHPNMGIGLTTKYKFMDSSDASKLRDDMISQLSTYLPQYQNINAEITLKKSTKELYVTIELDKTQLVYIASLEDEQVRLIDL